ncbi:MAG TPA: glucose-6-phosphate dehydrogenase [Trebonia sp.]|jgi:glucose-6-phosphate 1-dehydrogenase|nr:glucose-6-phosphate dehydrogenase [Trebonia sp.]
MIDRLVIFGATGDLMARYLLPGLAAVHAAGLLGERFRVTGSGREDWDNEQFRSWAAAQLGRHAPHLPATARQAVVSASEYRQADVRDAASVAAAVAARAGEEGGPVAAYLALPPPVFPSAVRALRDAGLPAASRIVLEKPFGEDLASAASLNRLLAETMSEQDVFRVDHFLAMTTVQNLLGFRLANRVIEPIWNSAHIAEVDIVWDESLALEGRAVYYDGVGALKDMVQNHLLQLLCLIAMEPPVTLGERDLRDRKVDVLRSVRPLTAADAARTSRRARYAAGRIGDRDVPAYVNEEGVDPALHTETFAEVRLEIDNWRWLGTVFRLRTGKGLACDRKEVIVRFREVPHMPADPAIRAAPNVLRFGLEPESLALELSGVGARVGELSPQTLAAELERPEFPAYGQLLLGILNGEAALSIRGDEAEEAWRVVTPVLEAWSADLVPMEEYPAGSDGPEPR